MSRIPIYTNPRNPAHVRATLGKLSRTDVNLVVDIGELEEIVIRTAIADTVIGEGEWLYATTSGHAAQAQATTAAKSLVVGIGLGAAGVGETVTYLAVGALTRAGWGLTTGVIYYLSAVSPGEIVSAIDASDGEYIVPVGRAVSSETLLITHGTSILL